MGFLGAQLSVNQGFCGQNLGQGECLFFIIYGTLDRTVGDTSQGICAMQTFPSFRSGN
jgi:hypothetical protein